MRETNIRSIDLNLLVALKALLDEKHVSRAALRLGLSQPAMSRALGRLRVLLKDPLLVKGSSGFDLTTRAQELFQPLQNILGEINQILSPPNCDPALMKDEIVIATRDYEMVSILPNVINIIAKEAPGLKFQVVPLVGNDLSPLDNNGVDFIITGTDTTSTTLCRQLLYKEEFACLVAADNPILNEKLTLKNYCRMRHCMVTITGFGPGIVDKTLEEHRHHREITVRVPHFLAAAYIVAASDLIVTLPKRAAILLSQQQNMTMLEPPIKIRSFSIYLYWHMRNQNNPMHKWLRRKIRDNCN